MAEQISFKSFKLEGNRVVLSRNSMIPLDSVSFITYGIRQNQYKVPLLILGVLLVLVVLIGAYVMPFMFFNIKGVFILSIGLLIILAALYKTSHYQIVSDSGRYLSIDASSDESENQEFVKFSSQLLDAKEQYIKK